MQTQRRGWTGWWWMAVVVVAGALCACKSSQTGLDESAAANLHDGQRAGKLAFIGCQPSEKACQTACVERAYWVKPDSSYCQAEGMIDGPWECYCQTAAE